MEEVAYDVAVVDDDLAILDAFRFLFEVVGLSVVTYSSALKFLKSNPLMPRCIIMDCRMPVMTGLELAASLRADNVRTPLLLITSSVTESITAQAVQLEIECVLEKPSVEEDLLKFVGSYCSLITVK